MDEHCGTGAAPWWSGMSGLYEGDGAEATPLPPRRMGKTTMTKKTTNPFSGTTEGQRLATLGLPEENMNPADELYAQCVRAMRGIDADMSAGVVTSGEPAGGADLSEGGEPSDDAAMEAFEDVLSGREAQRRAQANVTAAERERREKLLADARSGTASLPRQDEDLRPQLSRFGY